MSRSGSTINLHGAVTATSKSPLRRAWNQADILGVSCFAVTPICRHWSMSPDAERLVRLGAARSRS